MAETGDPTSQQTEPLQPTQTTPDPWPWPEVRDKLRLESSALWATAFVVYLALRLLLITKFNISSALTVLSAGGTATALLGTIVTILPAIPVLLVMLSAAYFWSVGSGATSAARISISTPWLYILASCALCFFFTPWPLLVILPGLLFEPLLTSLRYARGHLQTISPTPPTPYSPLTWPMRPVVRLLGGGHRFVLFWLLLMLLLELVVAPNWFPQENLLLKHTPGLRTAIVVSLGDDWTTLLDPHNQQIVYLPTSEILSRQNCHPASDVSRPLFLILLDYSPQPVPACSRLGIAANQQGS